MRAVLTLLAVIAFLVSPMLSTGFNGYTPDQFPIPQIDPPVQPLAPAFSIWGLIYAWLLAGAGFGLWKRRDAPDWDAMRPWLIASTGAGAFWIALAQRDPVAATALILVMLATAVMAFWRAGEQDAVWQVRPVALYTGWLTAASGVAAGVCLAGYGLLSANAAAILCLLAVLAVALVVHLRRPREWAYPAALIWALGWVLARNIGMQPVNAPVAALAALMILALAGFMLRGLRLPR